MYIRYAILTINVLLIMYRVSKKNDDLSNSNFN